MGTMQKTSDLRGGGKTWGCSGTKRRRAGGIYLSTEGRGNALEVSAPCCVANDINGSSNIHALTVSIVDFAMTETAYTVVRLLQRFSVLEKPDDEVDERTGREQQTMTLVLAIKNGCRVRFAN
jgi:hypothetical protein